MKRIIVGITGASGAAYAVRLVELLALGGAAVDLTVTEAGLRVMSDEVGLRIDDGRPVLESVWPDGAVLDRIAWWPAGDLAQPTASGSTGGDAMAICPCSINTLGAVACGLAANVVQRAAQVALKERRPLVIVPRETPLAAIHLENMLRLAHSGATILPAMPAFYHRPQRVADLVDFVVARVLDALGVPHDLQVSWSPDRE